MWSSWSSILGANSFLCYPVPVWPGQSRFPVDVLIRYAVLTAVVKCVFVHTVDMWLKDPVSCVCNQKGVARRLAVGSLVSSLASVTRRISWVVYDK